MLLLLLSHFPQSMVFQMSINPSGSVLASVDVSGNLSLWDLPSFRLKRKWTPQDLVSVVCIHHFSLLTAPSPPPPHPQ